MASGDEPVYDRHYAESDAACGAPCDAVVRFADQHARPGLRVLDLGCGQGRDALLFARAGCHVVGLDVSSVGIAQLHALAVAEDLDVLARVGDVQTLSLDAVYDVVILDRVLHMLDDEPARQGVLSTAIAATAPGGHVLVADEPRHQAGIRQAFEPTAWERVLDTRNRLFVRRRLGA